MQGNKATHSLAPMTDPGNEVRLVTDQIKTHLSLRNESLLIRLLERLLY